MTCENLEFQGFSSSHTGGGRTPMRLCLALPCQVVDAWAPKEDSDTLDETGLEVGEHEKERREDRDLWSFQRTGSDSL